MATMDDKPNDTAKRPRPKKEFALYFNTGTEAREARFKLGMNQSEFWYRLGVTQSTGSRYESGRDLPKTIRLLMHLVYATGKQSRALVAHLRSDRSRD